MPRKQKKLTRQQADEVETLAAFLSIDQIADYFGMGKVTFYEIMKRQPIVSERYKKGRAKAIGSVAQGLLMRAREGDTASAIFYLKTQGGWSDKTAVDVTNSDGSMRPVNIEIVGVTTDRED